jgi:predicted CopG family antitoxin
MAERFHRTQLLLEPELHRTLAERANREGRSLSELVRKLLWEKVDEQDQAEHAVLQRRLAGLERIREHREEMLARRGGQPIDFDAVEAINRMREEQDERNTPGISASRN